MVRQKDEILGGDKADGGKEKEVTGSIETDILVEEATDKGMVREGPVK